MLCIRHGTRTLKMEANGYWSWLTKGNEIFSSFSPAPNALCYVQTHGGCCDDVMLAKAQSAL